MMLTEPSRLCIFLLSGSALAYEVILIRFLSITRFHHLTFMVLSLALLAYGASGVLLARRRAAFLASYQLWFCILAGLFAVGSIACFQLSQYIPLLPGDWLWSPLASLQLVALYVTLSLPFFAAACGVGLAYCAKGQSAALVYRADLLGAATGSLCALVTLCLPEAMGLWLPWTGGFIASALMAKGFDRRLAAVILLAAFLVPTLNPERATKLLPSTDKPLSVALNAEGAHQVADLFTALGRITVTENTLAPYRHAPGLSLAYGSEIPGVWGAFTDGEAFAPLLPTPDDSSTLDYLDYTPEALAYRLVNAPKVLVLGDSFSEALALAVTRGAREIDVVVSNPGWRTLLAGPLERRTGGYFTSPEVKLLVGAPRGALRTGNDRYDLISIGHPAQSALVADHLHTVEAFTEALRKLNPGGVLSLSAPSDLPPRAGLRLLATAKRALEISGAEDPALSLAMIRSLRTVNLIVRKGGLTTADIMSFRDFYDDKLFDPVWFPGISLEEVNRRNRLDEPHFYRGALELLGSGSELFQRRYKFNVSPLHDEKPYFSHFIKPGTLKELFALRGRGGLGLLSLAEPVLATTLVQASLLSFVVVWLPLRRFRARSSGSHLAMTYFMLGAGFMLTEFAVLEKMNLFLSQPVLSVSVTLATFLAFAGLGGGVSSRMALAGAKGFKRSGSTALVVAGLILLYMAALPVALETFIGYPLTVRLVLAPLFMAPLAFAMGFPFPLAVAALKGSEPSAVPWAWGVNGCASVIGPVSGVILALYWGLMAVLATAAICYAMVYVALSGRG